MSVDLPAAGRPDEGRRAGPVRRPDRRLSGQRRPARTRTARASARSVPRTAAPHARPADPEPGSRWRGSRRSARTPRPLSTACRSSSRGLSSACTSCPRYRTKTRSAPAVRRPASTRRTPNQRTRQVPTATMMSTSGASVAFTLRARNVRSTVSWLSRSRRRSSKSSRANAFTRRTEAIDSCTTDASSLSFLLTSRAVCLMRRT